MLDLIRPNPLSKGVTVIVVFVERRLPLGRVATLARDQKVVPCCRESRQRFLGHFVLHCAGVRNGSFAIGTIWAQRIKQIGTQHVIIVLVILDDEWLDDGSHWLFSSRLHRPFSGGRSRKTLAHDGLRRRAQIIGVAKYLMPSQPLAGVGDCLLGLIEHDWKKKWICGGLGGGRVQLFFDNAGREIRSGSSLDPAIDGLGGFARFKYPIERSNVNNSLRGLDSDCSHSGIRNQSDSEVMLVTIAASEALIIKSPGQPLVRQVYIAAISRPAEDLLFDYRKEGYFASG